MNNNAITERALRDIFAVSSYVDVGVKDAPVEYGKQPPLRSCYKTKQFLTNPAKWGLAGAATNDVYFEKKHPWISEGDNFVDRTRYMDTQKEKKKGFLTGDFHRRDEFANTVRTEQYREQLKSENDAAKAVMDDLKVSGVAASQEFEESSRSQRPGFDATLFDRVHDNSDNIMGTKGGASRQHRWTTNPTQLNHDREFGTYKTTSQLIGYAIGEQPHSKPQYARAPVVQSTFFRQHNVFNTEH